MCRITYCSDYTTFCILIVKIINICFYNNCYIQFSTYTVLLYFLKVWTILSKHKSTKRLKIISCFSKQCFVISLFEYVCKQILLKLITINNMGIGLIFTEDWYNINLGFKFAFILLIPSNFLKRLKYEMLVSLSKRNCINTIL